MGKAAKAGDDFLMAKREMKGLVIFERAEQIDRARLVGRVFAVL
jgi:hypothetical protein